MSGKRIISCGLRVVRSGMMAQVQDGGRRGYGDCGVPTGGAVDGDSLRIANLLTGNGPEAAGIESLMGGMEFEAAGDLLLAVTGAPAKVVDGRQPCSMWRSLVLRHGRRLYVSAPERGMRIYIAVAGGIAVPKVLGSRATCAASSFGGWEGRPLKTDDFLPVGPGPRPPHARLRPSPPAPGDSPPHIACGWPGRAYRAMAPFFPTEADPADIICAMSGMEWPRAWRPVFPPVWRVRCLWGPSHEDFSLDVRQRFVETEFTVSPSSNHMGVRLMGPEIPALPDLPASILSEGVVPGAIQIPGDGRPIIMLRETVTGGYRKIATVIGADLSLAGRMQPGDRVRFNPVTRETALAGLRRRNRRYARVAENLHSSCDEQTVGGISPWR